MAQLRKYLFGTQATATKYIKALGVDEDGQPTHNHKVKELGNVPDGYDEDGNPIMGKKIAVDVIWADEPAPGWKRYVVWPGHAQHTMGGVRIEMEYNRALKVERPELFPSEELEEL